MLRALFFLSIYLVGNLLQAQQDKVFIKVHFLYGSKPKKEFRDSERKWFGGKLGGHVGIETSPDTIIDFGPSGKFHYISHRNNRHSHFTTHDTTNFWEIFGTEKEKVERMSVWIPITLAQKKILDSVAQEYLNHTPYDYAFIGMRCGAAAYNVLSKINIVNKRSRFGTYMRIFYPRKLRRKLMRKARKNGWKIQKVEGTVTRNWERD